MLAHRIAMVIAVAVLCLPHVVSAIDQVHVGPHSEHWFLLNSYTLLLITDVSHFATGQRQVQNVVVRAVGGRVSRGGIPT